MKQFKNVIYIFIGSIDLNFKKQHPQDCYELRKMKTFK